MSVPLRLRQAVLAATDLEGTAERLTQTLGLGEPFSDPAVGMFGLRNLVFALGDTFLEVVSPVSQDAAAARLLSRRGETCGYMLMFQLADLPAARSRAEAAGVREVFAVELEDMQEVHLHPADMRGAIVSLSCPRPAESWRWGGPGWEARAAALRLRGAAVAVAGAGAGAGAGSVAGAGAARERWETVLGAPLETAGVRMVEAQGDGGLFEISLTGESPAVLELGAVRLCVTATEEE